MFTIVPEKKVAKINVTIDDDINLILDAISKVDPAYVMLIIPQGNDLINSPIGLKALRKKTFEKGKRIIVVVPKGIAHELTTEAGFVATTSQESVTGDLWQTAEKQYEEFHHARVGMPSKSKSKRELKEEQEAEKSTQQAEMPKEEKKQPIEYISREVEKSDPEKPPEIISSSTRQVLPPVPEEPSEPDIKEEVKKAMGPNVTGMDFSKLMRGGNAAPLFTKKTAPITITPERVEKAQQPESKALNLDVLPKKVGETVMKLNKQKGKAPSPFAKFMSMGLVAFLVLFGGVFVMYYLYFPGVRVDIVTESFPIQITKDALATSAVTGFDANKMEIQLTKEIVPKTGVLEFTPKEKGSEGTKATGQVTLKNYANTVVKIPANTKFNLGGKDFVTSALAEIQAGNSCGAYCALSVQATAISIGEEYNIGSIDGQLGDVVGFPNVKPETVTGFTGGTKRDFTVVGQKEVDEAIKTLTKQLEEQALSDLELTNLDNGYVFIRNSVKTTVKGKATISPAVGSEVKETDEAPNVKIDTETTGLYYHKRSLEQLAEKLIIDTYMQEKQISSEQVANTIIEDLEVTVSEVVLGKDDKVTVKFNATGLATYRLDKEKIRVEVAGKKTNELADYVANLPGLSRTPDITYTPFWLPEFMRYVPKQVNRIDVRITVAQPVAEETAE